jgi:hypothetical protein
MVLRSPPRPARAKPGVSEAASAPLSNSETYRPFHPAGVVTPRRRDEGELFSDQLMSLSARVAPGVTPVSRATSGLSECRDRIYLNGHVPNLQVGGRR